MSNKKMEIMLVDCSSCKTPLQLPPGAKIIRCALCWKLTRIGDPRAASTPHSTSHAPSPPPPVPTPSPYNHAPPPSPHGRKKAVICGSCVGDGDDKDNDETIVEREEELNDVCLSSSSSSSMVVVPVYSSRISPKGKFNFRQFSIKSWQKGAFLGSGSFGTVYEGYTVNGVFCAVKEVNLLDKGSQGQESILQLEQEISLLSRFEHENIVQYFGTTKDEARLYIFLELVAKGSLLSLYRNYTLCDSQASSYTRQILNGLKYLHERNVVHRDIKCANILIDTSGTVKLADFGLAKATISNDIKSCKGTVFWMAPEVVNSKENGYGLAADIWSLGCTVLEMLTCQHPYSHLEWMQAAYSIAQGELPPVPNSLSPDAQDFIHICLQVNPDNRPTPAQLLKHSFVKRSTANYL